MLRISKYGMMLAVLAVVPSAYATDVMVPVANPEDQVVLVSSAPASDIVAPIAEESVVVPVIMNEKVQGFDACIKYDLYPVIAAVKEKYQLPGNDLNTPRAGLLSLLSREVCIKDDKESALLVKERNLLKAACLELRTDML
jgi:hypothetical protein